jgi:hypothetical protein
MSAPVRSRPAAFPAGGSLDPRGCPEHVVVRDPGERIILHVSRRAVRVDPHAPELLQTTRNPGSASRASSPAAPTGIAQRRRHPRSVGTYPGPPDRAPFGARFRGGHLLLHVHAGPGDAPCELPPRRALLGLRRYSRPPRAPRPPSQTFLDADARRALGGPSRNGLGPRYCRDPRPRRRSAASSSHPPRSANAIARRSIRVTIRSAPDLVDVR